MLIIKEKLILIATFEKWALMTKLAKDHGVGLQTIYDMNNKIVLMKSVRKCYSDAGSSGHKIMKK